MLLVDVDTAYGAKPRDTEPKARKILEKAKVDWPNVHVDDGWNTVMHLFNVSGYGLTLIGPDGVVLGVDVHDKQVSALLRKLYPDQMKGGEKGEKRSDKGDAPAATQPAQKDPKTPASGE